MLFLFVSFSIMFKFYDIKSLNVKIVSFISSTVCVFCVYIQQSEPNYKYRCYLYTHSYKQTHSFTVSLIINLFLLLINTNMLSNRCQNNNPNWYESLGSKTPFLKWFPTCNYFKTSFDKLAINASIAVCYLLVKFLEN